MLATWFMDLPWILAGLIFISAFTFLMLFIFWMTRKIVSAATLKECHDVAGFTYSIIGMVYGV